MDYTKIVWKISWILIRFFLMLFGHFKINGLENVKETEPPIIIVANHACYVDPFALGVALPFNSPLIPIRYIIKSIYDVFPLNIAAKSFGGFFINEKSPLTVKKALKILKEKGNIGIFPEGTRTKDGNLQKFEQGACWLAQKSKASILPVGISGTFEPHSLFNSDNIVIKIIDKSLVCIWKIVRFFLFRYKITVNFGKPFNIDYDENPTQAIQLLKSKVFELLVENK